MITICTACVLFNYKYDYFFYNVARFTEEELLRRVEENDCAIWLVPAHPDSVFRSKFISDHLSEDGYVIGGYYHTFLCGKRVDFRLVENVNYKFNHEKIV